MGGARACRGAVVSVGAQERHATGSHDAQQDAGPARTAAYLAPALCRRFLILDFGDVGEEHGDK